MSTGLPSRPRRLADGVLVGLFAAIITLPGLDLALGGELDPTPVVRENRVRARPPEWSWERGLDPEFTASFQTWFDDSFGFRDALLRLNSALHLFGLGVSVDDSVLVGKDGWLYLADLARPYHLAEDLFSEAELDRWRVMLEERRDWLARRGTEFLFVIAPNKHSVHPEHLPDALARRGPRSRADQLVEHMRERSNVVVLDLREVLRPAHPDEPLYYATDSHWNRRGARLAYEAVLAELRQWFPLEPPPEDLFKPGPVPRKGGDLAQMLAVETFVEELEPYGPVNSPRWHFAEPVEVPGVDPSEVDRAATFATEVPDPSLPSAVIVRDSFMNQLAPLLSNHLRRAVFVDLTGRLPFPVELIEQEDPDLVMIMLVERMLMGPAVGSPPELRDARAARRLEDGRALVALDLDPFVVGGVTVRNGRLEPLGKLAVLDATTDDPALTLPTLPREAGRRRVVHWDGAAPAETVAMLFELRDGVDGRRFERLASGPVTTERATTDLELPPWADGTGLRLDPGIVAGRYVMHALEVHDERVLLDALGPDAGRLEGVRVSLQADADGLLLRAEDDDPRLLLPARLPEPGEELVVLAELTTDRPISLQVYWSEDGAPGHQRDRMVARPVPAGRHRVRVPLPVTRPVGTLRVDPGVGPGVMTVHALELVSRRTTWTLDQSLSRRATILGAEVSPVAGGLALDAPDGDPRVVLPAVTLESHEQALVVLDVTAPAETTLVVFYLPPGETHHAREHSRAVKLAAGRQRLVVDLPAGPLGGPIRVDPGMVSGRYVIHALEVRAADL